MIKQADEGTKRTILFLMGVLLEVISIIYYNDYQIPAILGIFFIVKSLS